MRIHLLVLASLALAPAVEAQFESRQFFIGEGNSFLAPVDGGYLRTVEHHHVRWDAEQRTYYGLDQRNMRVMPLGESRLLMEYDQSQSDRTWVHVVRWDGAELHFFDLDVERTGSR